MARQRLGSEPLVELFRMIVKPQATERTKGAFYKGYRLVGCDGAVYDLPDCEAHQDFDIHQEVVVQFHLPQLRKVSLVELGTHIEFAFNYSRPHQSEKELVKDLSATHSS